MRTNKTVGWWWKHLKTVTAVHQFFNLSEWIHPADWLLSFRGSRLLSKTLIKALSVLSDRLHQSCPTALMEIRLHQVTLSGFLPAVIIADVFLPSISFPQNCQSEMLYEMNLQRERDINKNAARTYLVCVTAQEMKSVWQKRNWGDEVNQINQRSKFNLCAKVLSTHQRT